MHDSFFLHSSAAGHLGWFHELAIVTCVAVLVTESPWTLHSRTSLEESLKREILELIYLKQISVSCPFSSVSGHGSIYFAKKFRSVLMRETYQHPWKAQQWSYHSAQQVRFPYLQLNCIGSSHNCATGPVFCWHVLRDAECDGLGCVKRKCKSKIELPSSCFVLNYPRYCGDLKSKSNGGRSLDLYFRLFLFSFSLSNTHFKSNFMN